MPSSSTTLVTSRAMLAHKCEWDETHIERPDRLKVIIDCLDNNEVSGNFTREEGERADIDDILLVHTKDYVDEIKRISETTIVEMEKYCTLNEDIYVNSSTYDCALLSAGSCVQALKSVVGRKSRNAFAAVRPPGHHAWQDAGCGFCIFNNVVICAKKGRALQLGCERVLIVDWDVHAGQGTQYCISDDQRIRLISSHRYEEGRFWPQLPESAIKNEYANTINLPLNEVGYGDAEYIYFLNNLILPIIDDFNPELILVSCGFDAALGDPEGEMKITPAGYGMMLGCIAALEIPLCVILEGGYFLDSVKEGFKMCMDALVNKKPPLPLALRAPSEQFADQLLRCMQIHQSRFPSIHLLVQALESAQLMNGKPEVKIPPVEYHGIREFSSPPYQTRNLYPPRPEGVELYFKEKMRELMDSYTKRRAEQSPCVTEQIRCIFTANGSITLSMKKKEVSIQNVTDEEITVLFYLVVQHLQTNFTSSEFVIDGFTMPVPITLNSLKKKLRFQNEKRDGKRPTKKRNEDLNEFIAFVHTEFDS